MSYETTLLPCPFCGGEAEICYVRDICTDPQDWYWGKCLSCRINGKQYPTEAEAIAAWNTRAQTVFGMTLDEVRQMMKRDAERERTCKNVNDDNYDGYFTCSSCGAECSVEWSGSGYGAPRYCPNCGARVER